MGLKEIFKKQGGLNLVKSYLRSGTLVTAVGEFLLLGKSRTSLEILRLSTQLKAKQKVEKKYKKVLSEFDKNYSEELPHTSSNKVWICWFQGIEKAPLLVQRCYQSVRENLPNREVVLITSDNMSQYVQFPDYIMEKWEKGIITHTHMTDLLRLELLIKYGGMWVDATVLCTENESKIPSYFFDSELFLFQSLKPGRDGHTHINSSWLISAKTNNRILMAVRYLCYEYWKTKTFMMDYFLVHDFFAIAAEVYSQEWNAIIPRDNATPHILLLRLFDEYDEKMWNAITTQTPFHKLTYKFSEEQTKKQNTFYAKLFGGE